MLSGSQKRKVWFGMEGIQNLNAVAYKTADSVTDTVTRQNGIDALTSDKNSMPIENPEYASVSKLERTPDTDTVSFSDSNKTINETETETPKEASTAKKVGVGIASSLIPGLGQAINGQWGKAAGFFFGETAAISLLGAVGWLGIGIWSVVDAVKNAQSN